MDKFRNCVGRRRGAAGLRQQELAARVGISRQRLSTLESGRGVPSAALALRLAKALGCKVEELFWVEDERTPVVAEIAADSPPPASAVKQPAGTSRVALASIDGRWVAHRLSAPDASSYGTAAGGLLQESKRAAGDAGRVVLLGDESSARATLLCAGCAPAFGVLAARASAGRAGDRVLWLDRSSTAALDLLARGQVHVAGAHLYDEQAREFNVPFIAQRLPGRAMLVFNLARWEAGLVVAPGNPRRIRGVRDLARKDVTFIRRQPGSAAQQLVERLLRDKGLPASLAAREPLMAGGHGEVARLVALGVADAGLAIAAVARPLGLDFIPLTEERFDLVLSKELADDGRVTRLLDTLASRMFRREMESLGGHVVRDAGKLIADTSSPNWPTLMENR
ncbi:MAG TPA: substrate-binding domain-containing protein [Polyangia bacterium]|nr:substrate-binding domain-containing protein [Polyangia bacterium]